MPISKHDDKFFGLKIVEYVPNRPIKPKTAPRLVTYEHRESHLLDTKSTFESLRKDPKAGELTALVIGPYNESWDGDAAAVIKELTSAASKRTFTSLAAVFLGDIVYEEQEISWIHVGNPGKILDAFPGLECLRVRGTEDFKFKCEPHSSLKTLIIESGGLNKSVVKHVLASSFPQLEHLELWLGSESYGANHKVDDLMPLLSGRLFPRLKHLGLRNCEYTDDVARALADAPILKQLESLDLSMGTLGDEGAEALASSPLFAKLANADLSHHYMTPAMQKRLKGLGPTLKLTPSDRREGEEDRYIQVAE
jgi:hypothetical protein